VPALRILIVEDDPLREQRLRTWLPPDVKCVVAPTAGAAIGILRHDSGRVYAGVLLDHDLQARRQAESDKWLCGQDVVEAVVQHVDRLVPILIHSVNAVGRQAMATRLRRAGFDVVVKPMTELTKADIDAWLADIREAGDGSG
jgi:CheY-like chemotaxis protein